MNGYLLCVIGTVLISAFLTAIAPDGKTAAIIRNVAKLACTVAILAPILQFFKTGEIEKGGENSETTSENFTQTGIETDGEFIQYYCEFRVKQTQEKLERELLEKFQAQTQVTLLWELQKEEVSDLYFEENIFIKEMQILCLDELTQDTKNKIDEHIRKNYGCGVRIE